jgi:hypothetical protein
VFHDSQDAGGSTVYAGRDSYADEFKGADEVMAQTSALL